MADSAPGRNMGKAPPRRRGIKSMTLLFLLFLSLALLFACEEEALVYIKGQSAVTEVAVENGWLSLSAMIVLENRTKEELRFTMTGEFSALAASGAVSGAFLPAADAEGFSELLIVPAGKTVCLLCTFRGRAVGALPDGYGEEGFSPPPDSLAFVFSTGNSGG